MNPDYDPINTQRDDIDTCEPPIIGYRQLNEIEMDAINEIKRHGEALGELVERLRASEGIDQRWVSIGATDVQKGLMALVRSVAKPTTF